MSWVPGEAALIRLWETVEKLGTGLASPLQIRREGKAKAEVRAMEILAEAQAMKQAEEIRKGTAAFSVSNGFTALPTPDKNEPLSSNVPLALPPPTPDAVKNIADVANASGTEDKLRRLINVRGAVRHAEEELSDSPSVEAEEVKKIDDDWLFAWREGAERVSQEDLQRLWGRLLKRQVTGEAKTSLRTLSFLTTLDEVDVKLISMLAPFVTDGQRVLKIEKEHEKAGLDFAALLDLEDMGVIAGASDIGGLAWSFNLKANVPAPMLFLDKQAIVLTSAKDEKVEIPCYALSRMGRELVKLGDFTTDESVIKAVGQTLVGPGRKLETGRVASQSGTSVHIPVRTPLVP